MILCREKRFVVLPLILAVTFIIINFISPYQIIWQVGRLETAVSHSSYNRFSNDRFIIYFDDDISEEIIEDVLRESEKSYDFLQERLPFEYDRQIISVIYSDETVMGKKVPGGRGKGAVGVFTNSSVRILTPKQWMDYPLEFESRIPILHELTHFAVDRITNGNYPLWFTEGVALYMEKSAGKEPWQHYGYYAIKDMEEKFIHLDPYMAYGHALKLTEGIVLKYGDESLYQILLELGKGLDFHESFFNITGEEFYSYVTNMK